MPRPVHQAPWLRQVRVAVEQNVCRYSHYLPAILVTLRQGNLCGVAMASLRILAVLVSSSSRTAVLRAVQGMQCLTSFSSVGVQAESEQVSASIGRYPPRRSGSMNNAPVVGCNPLSAGAEAEKLLFERPCAA